jgi:hypothetical protein
MKTVAFSRRASLTLVTLPLSGLLACNLATPGGRRGEAGTDVGVQLASGRDTMMMVLRPIQDTIRVGEPAQLLYLIRNSGTLLSFRNDPTFFEFEVTDPSGKRLRPSLTTEPPSLGGVPELALPPGGVVGQIVDLSCGTWLYVDETSSKCAYRYSFELPGAYSVRLRYAPPAPPDIGRPGRTGPLMLSNTVHIVVTAQ